MGSSQSDVEEPPARYGRKIPLTEAERTTLRAERPSTHGRTSRLKILLVLIAAAIVIVAVFWYMYLLPPKGNTPEDAVNGFIDGFNTKDADEVVGHTVLRFADDLTRQLETASLEDMFDSYSVIQIEINSLQVFDHDEVALEIRNNLDEMVTEAESIYGVDVKDICIVDVNFTSSWLGDEYTEEWPMPCVRIGASWYVLIVPSMMEF